MKIFRLLLVVTSTVPAAAQLPPKADVLSTMRKVADYALDNNITDRGNSSTRKDTNCGWTHGTMLQGVMAAHRATSEEKYLDYALWWGEAQKYITCNFPKVLTEHAAANDMNCGQTYAEIYLTSIASGKGRNDTYIAHIRDKVLQVLVDRPQIDDWWWDDAYFMAMGTFARIGSIANDNKFFDKCFALFNNSAVGRGLWSDEDHLFFRDQTYQNKTTPHGKHVFWGRGEGWTSGALARTMEYLPKSHSSYAVYASHLQMMAKTLKGVQSADGMWRASVLDPTDPNCPNPETTGTSGMTFGLAWGVNNGVLDKDEYGPMVIKAWNGLVKIAVQDSGRLGYCQPIGGGPNPSNATLTSDFCVGLFLLAAEQVAKMAGA